MNEPMYNDLEAINSARKQIDLAFKAVKDLEKKFAETYSPFKPGDYVCFRTVDQPKLRQGKISSVIFSQGGYKGFFSYIIIPLTQKWEFYQNRGLLSLSSELTIIYKKENT
jgi:hypothetical protein